MHVIGRGRTARETYPQSPRAGGGSSAIVPLTRQRFIDGGTVQPGLNGSVADPFATIAQFMASRTNVSAADATANYVGWVMPKLGGYVEAVAFPAYVSTELRADSFSIPGIAAGATVTGNVTWANIGGLFAATAAAVSLHNISVIGSFEVTDDPTAPVSTVVFGGDAAGHRSVFLGTFDSDTTTRLGAATFENATVGVGGTAINAGTSADSADVFANDCTVTGGINAKNIVAFNCLLDGTSAFSSRTLMRFTSCIFSGPNPTISVIDGTPALFDGTSWMSFAEAGGTRAAGTKVLVIGGYACGSVPGTLALPTGAGPTDVSLNGVNASAAYADGGNFYFATTLVANSVVRIRTGGGEKTADRIRISKFDLSAFTLTVQNNAGATIAVIPASERGFVEAFYNGTDWAFAAAGSVAA